MTFCGKYFVVKYMFKFNNKSTSTKSLYVVLVTLLLDLRRDFPVSIATQQTDLLKQSVKSKFSSNSTYPGCIYLFIVNNGDTRILYEICSKLTLNTPERRQWHRFGVFIFNCEQISQIILVFLFLTLNINVDWVGISSSAINSL